MDRINEIKKFFKTYTQNFNDALSGKKVNAGRTAALFAEEFIEASPAGIKTGKNNWFFRLLIPRGYAYYKKIGTRSMEITRTDITLLNDLFAMVKVQWKATYSKKTDTQTIITFEVIYFIHNLRNQFKIFAYIAGDEQKLLREHGLI